MKRVLLLFSTLILLFNLGHGQVEYKIRKASNSDTYTVSMRSSITWTGLDATAIAAQVTVSMPTGGFQKSNFQSIAGIWNHSANPVISPSENPGYDYFFFILSNFANNIAFQNGQEVDLFSFENSGVCTGALEIINHSTDPMYPTNSQSANVGNLMATFGGGNGHNAYTGNFDVGSAQCQITPADSDNDGIADNVDQCPNSLAGANVNAMGCTDSDGDGFYPDASPGSTNYDPNDNNVCVPQPSQTFCLDSDGDGINDSVDQCPFSATGASVNAQGCTDSDGDGFYPDATPGSTNFDPNDQDGCLPNNASAVCNTSTCEEVEYVMELLPDGKTYQFSMLSHVNWTAGDNFTSTAQVSIRVATGGFEVGNFQNLVPQVSFAQNSRYDSPSETPGFDYISFGLEGNVGSLTYTDGVKVPIFTFENVGNCGTSGLTLVMDDDIFATTNNIGANITNQLTTVGGGIDINPCEIENELPCTGGDSGDSDGDGVSDADDLCPSTPIGATVNAQGCSDLDGDGYFPGLNPNHPQYDPIDTNPCEPDNTVANCDDDMDGVPNGHDNCPLSLAGANVDANGCTDDDGDGFFPDAEPSFGNYDPNDGDQCVPDDTSAACDTDDDNDGVDDSVDQCPNSPAGANVNAQGCSDLDGDGYFPGLDPSHPQYDPIDTNPCEPDNTVASCDDDLDGVPNGHDNCPLSLAGANVDANGCTDVDGDGYFPDAEPSFANYDPEDNNVCIPNAAHALCDSDNDGIPNDEDDCPNSPAGANVNAQGCSDLDGDGYFPGVDPSHPQYDPIDTNPCEPDNTVANCDDDLDGVPNGFDNCPFSVVGANVDANGCTDDDGDGYYPDAEPSFANYDPEDDNVCVPDENHMLCDSDQDGVPNADDMCPFSPAGASVNAQGCSDLDGDGYFPGADPSDPQYDPIDTNPCEPDNTVANCDDDLDGVPNGFDNCPFSAAGANVDANGCTDDDGDGFFPDAEPTFANYDPEDGNVCVPDENHMLCDSDQDGVPNADDMCPYSPVGASVNAQGCSDIDEDGYYPGVASNHPNYDPNDLAPCVPDNTVANCDDDQDGIPNGFDDCPFSALGANVDANGCTDDDGDGFYPDVDDSFINYDPEDDNVCVPDENHILCDSDQDGVPNADDMCPSTPAGALVNIQGCSDIDEDGYYPGVSSNHPNYDPNDLAPCVPDNTVANCDDDQDGIPNGFDDCPFSAPGANVDANGCTDDDGDGFFPDVDDSFINYDPEDDNVCVPDENHVLCDSDQDGVPNADDMCPTTPAGAPVNAQGCSDIDEDGYYPGVNSNDPNYDPNDLAPCVPDNTVTNCDDDEDGIPNGFDDCPFSAPGANVDANGCTDDDGDGFFPDVDDSFINYDPEDDNVCVPDENHILCDSDQDGVPNADDMCPTTPAGAPVNAQGCSDIDEDGYYPGVDGSDPNFDPNDLAPCVPDNTVANCDDDQDGVPNGFDDCPFSASGANVDANGCTDDDGDGFFPDVDDSFINYDPEDDNVCVPDENHMLCDSDQDGVANIDDMCPYTPTGAPVNAQGCSDIDEDGYYPGVDSSDPNYDPNDLAPCVPDNTVANCDDDQDGVPNGFDDCPFSAPGANVDANGCTDDDGDGFFPDVDDSFINYDPEDDNPCVPVNAGPACDDDNDGVPNDQDQCPNSIRGATVDANGCSDIDGDGFFPDVDQDDPRYDRNDLAPCVPDNTVTNCDDDDDGVPNGFDDCPFSAPGANVDANGCTDDDGDGFFPDVDDSFINHDPEDGDACIPDNTMGDCGGNIDITLVNSKVFLQGAFSCTFGLMRDDLRTAGHIPLTEPYTNWSSSDDNPFEHRGGGGGESTTQAVLDVTGRDAIVDWIFAEFRDKNDPTQVLFTRSGLVQRDGDIVDVDGTTPLTFSAPNDNYYLSVKHRNHLGAMSPEPLEVVNGSISFDFSDPDQANWGDLSQRLMSTFQTCNGTFDNVMALWGGDADGDRKVILEGGGSGIPDKAHIFSDVVSHPDNEESALNYSAPGYYGGDTDMDGETRLQGLDNDIDLMIFFNIMANPGNTEFLMNYVITEQIPK